MRLFLRTGKLIRAVLAIAVAAVIIGKPTLAGSRNLPSQTITICSDAALLNGKVVSDLKAAGWQAVDPSDADKFSTILADGVAVAMSGDRTTRIDLPHALLEAQQFSASIFNAALKEPDVYAFLSHENGNAALVLIMDPNNSNAFRCIYSGPGDLELRETLELIAQMDDRAGLKQATPEIQIAVVDSVSSNRRVNTQFARFIRPVNDGFGRKARVELGFSLINASAN